MNKTLPLLVLGGMVVYHFVFNQEDAVNEPMDVKSVDKKVTYATQGTRNSWPELGQNDVLYSKQLTKKNYYLVFDGSGSMNDIKCSAGRAKVDVAKESVLTFIDKIPVEANIGLYAFDNKGKSERAALSEGNKNRIKQEIDKIKAGSGTPLRTAISSAYQALNKQALKQLGYGEYHMIVITDGEANTNENPSEAVTLMLQESPIILHTIGFCISHDHSLNQQGYTIYKTAENPEQLTQGLDAVLAEAPVFNVDDFADTVQ